MIRQPYGCNDIGADLRKVDEDELKDQETALLKLGALFRDTK